MRGDYRRAESIARQALAQPRKRESMMCFAIAQYSLSSALLAQGGLDEAAKEIVKAIELCRRFGSQWFQSHCFITLGDIESARSDWTAAKRFRKETWLRISSSLRCDVVTISALALTLSI